MPRRPHIEEGNPDTSWMEHGACRKDPESVKYFYPPVSYDEDSAVVDGQRQSTVTARANKIARKKYCDVCPVYGNCVLYAIDFEISGFWAGLGERTRRHFRTGTHSIVEKLDVQEIRRRSI
jgi:hypothetical protein